MSKPNLRKLLLPDLNTIESFSREFSDGFHECLIRILTNIEKLEVEAVEICRPKDGFWKTGKFDTDIERNWFFPSLTEEIPRKVTKAELLEFIKDMQLPNVTWTTAEMDNLADRIEKEGIA